MKTKLQILTLVIIFIALAACSKPSGGEPHNLSGVPLPAELKALGTSFTVSVILSTDPDTRYPLTLDTQTNTYKGNISVPIGTTFDLTIIYETTDPVSKKTIEVARYTRNGIKAIGTTTNVTYTGDESNWVTSFDLTPGTPNALNLDGDAYSNFVEISYGSDPNLATSVPVGPTVTATHKDATDVSLDVSLPPPGSDITLALTGDADITIKAETPFKVDSMTILSPATGFDILSTSDEIKTSKTLRIRLHTTQFVSGKSDQIGLTVKVTDVHNVSTQKDFTFVVNNPEIVQPVLPVTTGPTVLPVLKFNGATITGTNATPETDAAGAPNKVTLDGSALSTPDTDGSIIYTWGCTAPGGFGFTSTKAVVDMALPNISRAQDGLVILCTITITKDTYQNAKQIPVTVGFVDIPPQMSGITITQKQVQSPGVLSPENFSINWTATDADGSSDIKNFDVSITRDDKQGNPVAVTNCTGLTGNSINAGDVLTDKCSVAPVGYGEMINPLMLGANQDYNVVVTVRDQSDATNLATADFSVGDVGQVGRWRFEGNLGDTSENNKFGTFFNDSDSNLANNFADSGNSLMHSALVLDKSKKQYITIANQPNLGTNDFTVSAWVRPTTIGTTQAIMESIRTTTGYEFAIQGNGLLVFYNPACGGQISQHAIIAGQWHHVVATRKDSQIKLYINGELESVGVCAVNLYSEGQLTFGCNTDDKFTPNQICQEPFGGQMDEMSVFNRALTVDEIRRQCRAFDPTGTTCPDTKKVVILQPTPGASIPPIRYFMSFRDEQDSLGNPLNPTATYQLKFDIDTNGSPGTYESANMAPLTAPFKTNENIYYYVEDRGVNVRINYSYQLKVQPTINAITNPVWQSTRTFSADGTMAGWWKFDGDFNDSIGSIDALRSKHTATAIASSPTFDGTSCNVNMSRTDAIDQAACFNGTTQALKVGDFLDGTSQYTIEARFKTNETNNPGDGYGALVSKYDPADPLNTSYLLSVYGASKAYFLTYDDQNQDTDQTINVGLNDLEWHTVSGTYGPGIQILAIDGSVGAMDTFVQRYSKNSTVPLCFGAYCSTGNPTAITTPLSALIDEIIIYADINNVGTLKFTGLHNKFCATEAKFALPDTMPAQCLED